MQFNKLYNLILQSIITQNKATRRKMLEATYSDQQNITYIQKFLDGLNNNKAADFLCKYFCTGQLTDTDDPVIDKVLSILKRNTSFDTQKDISLDQFIKQNQKYLNRDQFKNRNINLDKIKVFSEKRTFDKGVVVYKVQNSKKGQEAVRRIIDINWGIEANPWCLASRSGHGLDANYREYWVKTYDAYPKAIAFQNGKLLAFSANDDKHIKWWDRNDKPSSKLKLLNGDSITTKPYTFNNIIEKYSELKLNKETKRYDYSGTLKITNEDLVDGHFPIPFGIIKGDFNCFNCTDLIDLSNGPTDVVCAYKLQICPNLTSLKGMSNIVGGSVFVEQCPKLTNLQGAPEFVGGSFFVMSLSNLKSLKGSPKEVQGSYVCSDNKNLTSLEGCSKEIGNNFDCSDCKSLISLKGVPEKVKGKFNCSHTSIKNLQGGPIKVGGDFDCGCNEYLETLDGAPDYVRGLFEYDNCPKLKVSKMYGARFRIPYSKD